MVTVPPIGPIMTKTVQMLGLFFAVCLISIIAGLLVSLSTVPLSDPSHLGSQPPDESGQK